LIACVAALLAAALPGRADDVPPAFLSEDVARFSAGIYCPDAPVRKDPAPGTASGTINIVEPPAEFTVETQRIPAVPGVGFGILIELVLGVSHEATILVTHPPFPDTGITRETWISELDSSVSLNGFTFEHLYELQPGIWSFTAVGDDGEPIYAIAFDVVDPTEAPELAGICAGLLSS